MAQVDDLNGNLEQTIEAYNYANIQLQQIDDDLASNAKHLAAAKKSLVVSRERIAERLRDLYVNGQGDSTLEVILGSSSLDDIIARLDAIERVSSQDAQILRTVKRYRTEVETRRSNLEKARTSQAQIVEDRASQKQSIESQLAEQNRLLASVQDEITRMRAEEARRQELAAEARSRAQAAQAAELAQQDAAQQVYDQAVVAPTYDVDVPAARYSQVVGIALQYLGVPYVWGGSSPSTGFDCSGFTSYVYAQVGVYLPHHAASQYSMGTAVPYSSSRPATSSSSAASATSGSTSAAASSCTRRIRATSSGSRASPSTARTSAPAGSSPRLRPLRLAAPATYGSA